MNLKFQSNDSIGARFWEDPDMSSLILHQYQSITLPRLPVALNALHIYDSADLSALPELPATLDYLAIGNCPGVKSLPRLPGSLRSLVLEHMQLTSLPELPSTLTQLQVIRCWLMKDLPELPVSLTHLRVDYCQLNRLPELPASLKSLHLDYCSQIGKLPSLPDSLTGLLRVTNCPGIKSLPPLPAELTTMHVASELFKEIPAALKRLRITVGWNQVELPALPDSLVELSFERKDKPYGLKPINVKLGNTAISVN